MKRTASGITPAVPVLPATPVRAPTPLRQETKPKAAASAEVATPTKPSAARRLEAVHNRAGEVKPTEPTPEHDLTEAKAPQPEPISEKAAPAQKKPKDVVKEAAGPSTVEIIKETPAESKPILKTWASSVAQGEPQQIAKPKAENLTSDVPGVKSDANANQADIIAPLPVKEPLAVKQDMKRKHPGKLDITAAVTKPVEPSVVSTTSTMARAETPGKLVRPGSIPPVASRPESPATVAESPIKRTAPRTLRVVSTPKAETPPPAPAPPMPAPVVRLPSRKPSVASINVPGTPSSEHISDTISLTSTSVSRANSPPPGGKVGTAPVRAKTKNQVKKERQERARQLEEEAKKAAEESKPSEEPVQEAIMSRKKKTKKPAASTSSAAATPANVSRPATPKEQPKPEEPVKPVVQEQKVKEVIPSKPASPTPVTRPASPESPHQVTAASLIQDLRNSQSRLSAAFDALLRPLAQTAVHYKPSQPITPADLSVPRSLKRNPDVNILPEQLASMMAKQHPLRYGGEDGRIWSRGCITPGGAHLRHLEASLEERFLDLEKSFRALPEELRYHPLTGQNIKSIANEFPRIDLDALRREFESGAQRGRDANAMEKAVEEGQKKGSFLVDTAGKYVNEFVMPPVPVSPGTAAGAKVGAGVTKDGAYKDAAAVMAEQRERQTPLSLEEAERLLSDARKITEEKEAAVRRLIKGNRKKLGMSNAVVL
ncbi:hypothetical protein M8818_001156 [Zalaria obscura]|uniref:Uncharacterized protein n=1 Tax=Zalaria obscura TaxID=2024903 RepID=A0ACC3SKZ3_9PEZI